MAQDSPGFEPAFAWAIQTNVGYIALLGAAFFVGYGFDGHPALSWPLRFLGAEEFLLALGVTGAMSEPLPKKPEDGKPGLRLRVSWGILGWCLPPGRLPRLAAAALTAAVFQFPFPDAEWFEYLPAGTLLVSALLMGRTGDILSIGFFEFFHWLAAGVFGFAALVMVFNDDPARAVQGVAVAACLLLLQGQRIREVCALRWAELLPGVPPPPALDLSRYELSVARKGPEKRAALPKGVEAQLVDTGSFRVDAAKMLDKLRSYQLSDPRDFLSAWLRCAAASGAKEVRLTTGWRGLELRFDGRAFSAGELSQPYQVLVDGEGPDAVRGRHLAYGLLGLYRLAPTRVLVTSRGPGGVAVMNAGQGSAPDPAAAPEGTLIRVEWPSWAAFWRPFLLARRARSRFGLCPAALSIDGKPVPDRPPRWHSFETEGWRAAYTPRLAGGSVRLFVLGTLIEEVPIALGADAWLSHDELELNISQSAVQRGALLSEGLMLVRDRSRKDD